VSQPEPAPDPTAAPAYPQAIHLHPTAPLAERVLLPGDPGRALALAQTLLVKPLMFNHHRGLWGYTGPAVADGEPLTIQSTGMGGPSAAIVLTELISLGAQRLIRTGTCGALAPDLALGDLVVARESICADGASRALGAGERVAADRMLAEALLLVGRAQVGNSTRRVHSGAIASVDLFYDLSPQNHPADALAIEMEAAALLAVGAASSVPVACILAVTDTFEGNEPHPPTRTRIDDDALLAASEAMGAMAVAALPV
jgi:uridine phosphorylase